MKPLRTIGFAVLISLILSTFLFAQDTGSVKGKVRAEDGDTISGAKVTARQNGKNLKSTQSDSGGKFRLRGLAPGRYNLLFEKEGFSPGVLYNVLVKGKKTNNLRDRLILKIDQGTLVIVEASVFNQDGFSLYGAKVLIEEVLADGKTKKVGSGYSSRDGDVVFRFNEKPTTYRITASAKGVKASKEVVVNEAAIYRTAITLNLPRKSK